jgi:hypothetical protein
MSQAGIINVGGDGAVVVETLTTLPSGTVVPPTANNINIEGSGGVVVTGNSGTSTITISIPASAVTWSDQATSFAAASANGYFVTATATATLPASPAEGATIIFVATSSGICTVTANTGQFIAIGTATSASAGTAASNKQGDSITLTYQTASTTWWGRGEQGTWTVT